MKKRTLGFKLVVGGIIAVLIPLVVVGVFAVIKSTSALRSVSEGQSALVANNLAEMVNVALTEEMKNVSGLTTDPAVIEAAEGGSSESANAKLTAMMKKIGGDYETLFVTDAAGVIRADGVGGSYIGVNVSQRDYMVNAKAGKASVGTPVKSVKTGNPVAVVCSPVLGPGGEVAGTVGAALADPAGVPVGGLEQPHGEGGGGTPGSGFAAIGPDAHLPIDALAGGKRLAGVGDPDGVLGGDAAGVPEVALIFAQGIGGAGHQDAVSALGAQAGGGIEHPTEAGVRLVDA